jgi:hypothetical protein
MMWRRIVLTCFVCLLTGCGGGGGTTPGVAPSTPRVGVLGTVGGPPGAVFVAYNSPTISAFGESNLSLEAQITTVGPNVLALALAPGEQTLYAATGFEGAACFFVNSSLVSIDTTTFTVTTTVPMPGTIVALGVSTSNGVIAAVAHEQSGNSYVYVIDAASLSITKKILLPFAVNVNNNGIAVMNNGTTAFVSSYSSGEIVAVDLVAGTEGPFHQFSSGSDLSNVALDPSNIQLYADTLRDIPIFSPSTGMQTGDIGLGKGQQFYYNFGESLDKSTIAVAGLNDTNQHNGTVIATTTRTVVNQFVLATPETNAAVNGNGSEAFFYSWGATGPPANSVNAYALPAGTFVGSAAQSSTSEYVTALAAE